MKVTIDIYLNHIISLKSDCHYKMYNFVGHIYYSITKKSTAVIRTKTLIITLLSKREALFFIILKVGWFHAYFQDSGMRPTVPEKQQISAVPISNMFPVASKKIHILIYLKLIYWLNFQITYTLRFKKSCFQYAALETKQAKECPFSG